MARTVTHGLPKLPSAGSAYFLLVFALFFAVPGIGCLVGGWWMCWKSSQIRQWEQTFGNVVEMPKRMNWSKFVYEFDWRGQTRTAQDGMTDSMVMEGEREAFWKEMKRAHQKNQPIEVWVNPEDPSESYVFPPRVSITPLFLGIFAISHGGSGLGILGGALFALRRARQLRANHRHFPDQPWNWRDDWKNNIVKPEGKPWFFLIGYLALVMLSLGGWVSLLLFQEPKAGIGERLIPVIVFAVGLVIAWWAVKSRANWKFAQGLELKLPADGILTGRHYQLELENREGSAFRPAEIMREWQINGQKRTGRGKNSRTSSIFTGDVSAEAISGRKSLLSFEIPPDASQTSALESTDEGDFWELIGDGKGVSKLKFQLPVFARFE